MKAYETETGFYEYVDEEGYKRIGKWEQKYVGHRYYGSGEPLTNKEKWGEIEYYPEDDDEYVDGVPDRRPECLNCLKYGFHSKVEGVRCNICGMLYSETKKQKKRSSK